MRLKWGKANNCEGLSCSSSECRCNTRVEWAHRYCWSPPLHGKIDKQRLQEIQQRQLVVGFWPYLPDRSKAALTYCLKENSLGQFETLSTVELFTRSQNPSAVVGTTQESHLWGQDSCDMVWRSKGFHQFPPREGGGLLVQCYSSSRETCNRSSSDATQATKYCNVGVSSCCCWKLCCFDSWKTKKKTTTATKEQKKLGANAKEKAFTVHSLLSFVLHSMQILKQFGAHGQLQWKILWKSVSKFQICCSATA